MRDPEELVRHLRLIGLFEVAYEVASEHHLTVQEMLAVSRVRPRPAARYAFAKRLLDQGMSKTRVAELTNSSVVRKKERRRTA